MHSPFTPPCSPYNLEGWSDGYVKVTESGALAICPQRNEQVLVLRDLLEQARAQGLRTPLLMRFSTILHDRVNTLVGHFNQAAEQQDYGGRYRIVYPIKVNQQRRVVEEILNSEPARTQGQVGLEAGSKPELLAVLALALEPGAVIVCNGYKDREYIQMALLGQRLGYRVFIVAEKLSELRLIVEEAEILGITPNIGVRARLATVGKGKWQNSGGEKSKFGLSAGQILDAIQYLRERNHLQCLNLLHFHLGSQIANIRDIQCGLQECAMIFSQLRQLGAPIATVDIGGGLGVDYDGTRSRGFCSTNYRQQDYARKVVQTFKEICERDDLPHPDLISESGRALTAHHALLITDVVAHETPQEFDLSPLADDAPNALHHLWEDWQALQQQPCPRPLQEIYHDAAQALQEIHEQFVHGTITLAERAQAEQMYIDVCQDLRRLFHPLNNHHREILSALNEKMAEKLFVNFSLFQSLPDAWGIDQIFPILPLERLHEPLTRHAVVQDITCDSDGRVEHYVGPYGVQSTLLLPERTNTAPELLCFFMVGAYQEILGDMHNLFGDTDSVDVVRNAQGEYELKHALRGNTIADVLEYVNLEPDYLLNNYRSLLRKQSFEEAQIAEHLLAFEQGLTRYTYLVS
jgi:arginine decarboxylase